MHRISPVVRSKMANEGAALIQSAAKQNPNRKTRQRQRRTQKRLESLSCKMETESLQLNTAPLMETVQQDQPPMVQDNSDVTENDQASTDDLLQEMERLKSQLKEQQEQNHAQKILHEQQLKTHDEEAENQDYIIKRLKMERSDAFSRLQKKAKDAVQKEIDELKAVNVSLSGKLKAEQEKVHELQKKIMNGQIPELNSAHTQQDAELISENEALCLQVAKVKSELQEQEALTAEALRRVDDLEKQKERGENSQYLQLEAHGDPESKVISLKRDVNTLKQEVKTLEFSLYEERRTRVPQSEVTALQKDKADLQAERDRVRLQASSLKAVIRERDASLKDFQNKVESLEEENLNLRLSKEQKDADDVCSKVQEEENVNLNLSQKKRKKKKKKNDVCFKVQECATVASLSEQEKQDKREKRIVVKTLTSIREQQAKEAAQRRVEQLEKEGKKREKRNHKTEICSH